MGAKRYEELVVWQLANELKLNVYAIVARKAVQRDFKFHDQIVDSASSAPSAIAEGFGRWEHPEFAYFLRVAKASVEETMDHLLDGVHRRHWVEDDCDGARLLARRTLGAIVKLIAHLERTAAPGSDRKPRRKRNSRRDR